MSVFEAAVDDLFADANVAQDALFTPQGGEPVPVRVVARRPDAVTDVLGLRAVTETTLFDLRIADVAEPRAGDTLVVDGSAYRIDGAPRRDSLRLVWTLSAVAV